MGVRKGEVRANVEIRTLNEKELKVPNPNPNHQKLTSRVGMLNCL
jgi:hypothetical protein